jgi:hypothetical protein
VGFWVRWFLGAGVPTVFECNFEAVAASMSPDVQYGIERTDGLQYIIESISQVLWPIVLLYLQALPQPMKLQFGPLTLNTTVGLLPDILHGDTKQTFTALVNFAASLGKLKSAQLIFPPAFLESIESLLFSTHAHVCTGELSVAEPSASSGGSVARTVTIADSAARGGLFQRSAAAHLGIRPRRHSVLPREVDVRRVVECSP